MTAVAVAAVNADAAINALYNEYIEARDGCYSAYATVNTIRDEMFAKYNGNGPDLWSADDKATWEGATNAWSYMVSRSMARYDEYYGRLMA